MAWRSVIFSFLALVAACQIAPANAQPVKQAPVMVFAAASLKDALDAVAAAFREETGAEVRASYAASSALAAQIERDGPAEVFISADEEWMEHLAKRGLIAPESRSDLLGNKLVLIAGKDSPLTLAIEPGFKLAQALDGKRLAIAKPDAVPAGKYVRAALQKLGVWDSVADKLAPADTVRGALAFVARGEAPLGIVYESDAKAEPNVKIVATFPEDSHPPIRYPVALTQKASPRAVAFLTYLKSAKVKPIFEAQGFTVLP